MIERTPPPRVGFPIYYVSYLLCSLIKNPEEEEKLNKLSFPTLTCHIINRVSYWLCSLIKNPEEEDPPRSTCCKFFEGGHLPPGSWLGNIVNKNPPRGGGFFRSKCHIISNNKIISNTKLSNVKDICHSECVVSNVNESCPIYMSHVAYEWVMSYSHVTWMSFAWMS